AVGEGLNVAVGVSVIVGVAVAVPVGVQVGEQGARVAVVVVGRGGVNWMAKPGTGALPTPASSKAVIPIVWLASWMPTMRGLRPLMERYCIRIVPSRKNSISYVTVPEVPMYV